MTSKWPSYLDWTNKQIAISGTSYGPTDGQGGFIPWDGSKYNGIIEVFVELDVASNATGCVPNQIPGVSWQLYNYTTSSVIAGPFFSFGAGWNPRRSSNIASSMPAGPAILGIQFKKMCGTSAFSQGGRIVIYQQSTAQPKMMVLIPIGDNAVTNSINYESFDVSNTYEKHYEWLEANFNVIEDVFFGATIRNSAGGRTTNIQLQKVGGGSPIGTIGATTTTRTFVTSGSIKASIINGSIYTPFFKTSNALGQAQVENAFIIVVLNPMDKFQGVFSPNSMGWQDTSTSYGEEVSMHQIYDDIWQNLTVTISHQSTMKHLSAISAETILFDDGVQWNASELSTASTAYVIVNSGALFQPVDQSIMSISVKETGGGRGDVGFSSNNWLLQTVSEIKPTNPIWFGANFIIFMILQFLTKDYGEKE